MVSRTVSEYLDNLKLMDILPSLGFCYLIYEHLVHLSLESTAMWMGGEKKGIRLE